MAESMSEILNPGTAVAKPDGFPHAPAQWRLSDAESAAREANIDLGEDHWEAIRALQEYFDKHDRPNARELHDALDEKFHTQGGIRFLYGLFPGGPIAQGCLIAGLQPPAGASDPAFGSVQ
jgi:tRNA 2-thiouridine synthesizing protein E